MNGHRTPTTKGATLNAKETFEDAARAARRLAVVVSELAAMDEAWHHGEWLPCGSGGRYRDPTAGRAEYRMARTDRLNAERAELAQIVAEARALTAGVAALLGSSYGDALTQRYIEGRPWQEVADKLGVSLSTARNRANAALDTIDSLGMARVMQGVGTATD